MIGDDLQQYTYDSLLTTALEQVSEDWDKRPGSIIYDALAPICYVLAQNYIMLRDTYYAAFVNYAYGSELEMRTEERGIIRFPATYAKVLIQCSDDRDALKVVPMGFRCSTEGDNSVTFSVIEEKSQGIYVAECETIGTIGNEYLGPMLAITFVSGLTKIELTAIQVPARDDETDDSLRGRYLESLRETPFGGNLAQYRVLVQNLDGVGDAQIYPVWDGGGTVKIFIVDSDYNPVSTQFLEILQNQLDPENASGQYGVGLGLVPIGHKVTLGTPTNVIVTIAAQIQLQEGYSLSQVEQPIKQKLKAYIDSLRKQWGQPNEFFAYSLYVYHSRIIAYILDVAGVENVVSATLNGASTDLVMTISSSVNQVPLLGEVVLSE